MRYTKTITRWLLILGALYFVDGLGSSVEAKWYKSYRSGLEAMDNKNWVVALQHFQKALASKNKDTNKIRAFGVTFIEYYPHREIGICFYYLGLVELAREHLTISLRQVYSDRARDYLDRINRGDHPVIDRERLRKLVEAFPVLRQRLQGLAGSGGPVGGDPPPSGKGTEEKRPDTRGDQPSMPPNLKVSLYFIDPSNNGYLDAGEEGKLVVDISNLGPGLAKGLEVKLSPKTDVTGLDIGRGLKIAELAANTKQSVVIPIVARENVKSSKVHLQLDVREANGFDLDPPASVTFETRGFMPPKLAVADVGIDDFSQNAQIEPREIVELTVRIQNSGQGPARNVRAAVKLGPNVFITQESKREFEIGDLGAGSFRDISFSVFTNTRATSVPVEIDLTEATGRYAVTEPLDLPFYKPQKKAEQLVIAGRGDSGSGESGGEVASLSVDVDMNIPKLDVRNPDAVAVLIGVSRYQNPDVPAVDYGRRDATIMKQYLVNMFGYDPRRIIEVYDDQASLSAFKRIFEEQLANYVRAGRSDVFVYYSGHGAPDPETQEAFFVPYDCNPTYAKSTGYRVQEFYERLAALPARSVTVVIDACFSGSSDRGMLLKGVSPVFIRVSNPVAALENGVVFTSATGQQVSSWYHEKKHSLFTYYFLKGMRGEADTNADRVVTVDEMESYVSVHVPDQARYLNNREQTPEVIAQDKLKVLVRY